MAVGIITYNNEKHILETLQSIQKQSFKKFDLLISDDLSTDNTLEVIKYFIKKNKIKAKIYKQKKNLGITGNCNFLIKKIINNYKFFALSAGDDLMHKKKLEIGYKILNKNKEVYFLFSDCKWFVNNKFISINHFLFQKVPKTKSDLVEDFTVPTPTIIYKSEYFPKKGFDKKFKYLSDMVMVFNLWESKKHFFINKALTYYRKHSSSIMNSNKIYKERILIEKFFIKKKIDKKYPISFSKFVQLKLYSKLNYKIIRKKNISYYEILRFLIVAPYTLKWLARKFLIIYKILCYIILKIY